MLGIGYLLSRILESHMMSSSVTILNVTVTHLLSCWMVKSGIIGSWSRDPVLVSNQITNIYNIIKWIRIINNSVMSRGWETALS